MPRAHSRADADDLGVLLLVGDDLIEQRQNGRMPAIHDREAADLHDVERRQDCADRRFGSGNDSLVHQRLAHQARDHMLRTGAGIVHAVPPGAAALKMMVPTGSPFSAAVSCPGFSPLTNWISRM